MGREPLAHLPHSSEREQVLPVASLPRPPWEGWLICQCHGGRPSAGLVGAVGGGGVGGVEAWLPPPQAPAQRLQEGQEEGIYLASVKEVLLVRFSVLR